MPSATLRVNPKLPARSARFGDVDNAAVDISITRSLIHRLAACRREDALQGQNGPPQDVFSSLVDSNFADRVRLLNLR